MEEQLLSPTSACERTSILKHNNNNNKEVKTGMALNGDVYFDQWVKTCQGTTLQSQLTYSF